MTTRLLLLLLLIVPGFSFAVEIVVGIGDRNGDALDLRNGKFVGSLAKYYQCPFDHSGLSFDLRLLPMIRSLYLLEKGEIDIALPLVRVSERDEYAIFTRKMVDIPFHAYVREDIDLSGDITQYKFTVLRGSAGVDLVVNRNARIEEVNSWTQALRLAQLGRFDGAVIPVPVIRNVDPGLFEGMNKIEFGSIPLSMYVSKAADNAEELVQRLNNAIDQCAEGRS